MRVLQINATYGTGSTGEIVTGIAHVAAESEIEMFFACAIQSGIPQNEHFFVVGNSFEHKIHALYSRIVGSQGNASYFTTKKLLKWIDGINPDIIHLHNLHGNYINLPLLFKYIKSNRIQTLITLHDCWYFTGKCCHFLYDNCNKWTSGCGNCPRKRKEIPSYFFDKSARDFAVKRRLIGENPYVHVVGCSDWLTNCARKSLLADRVEKTINNGIDLNIFKPVQDVLKVSLYKEGRFVLMGMANKWLSEDNMTTFDYISSHLDSSTVLLLIGCSPLQIQSNKRDNVIMIRFIADRNELATYYSLADVFVNVTKVDSFPTVNIESLACGTPVITYDSGGSSETVDEQTGMVVPYGDYKKLFQCIMTVKANGKEFYSDRCRKRAESFFDKNVRFKEYVDLYQEILAHKKIQMSVKK